MPIYSSWRLLVKHTFWQKINKGLYSCNYCDPSNYHCDKWLGVGFDCKGCVSLKALKHECLCHLIKALKQSQVRVVYHSKLWSKSVCHLIKAVKQNQVCVLKSIFIISLINSLVSLLWLRGSEQELRFKLNLDWSCIG